MRIGEGRARENGIWKWSMYPYIYIDISISLITRSPSFPFDLKVQGALSLLLTYSSHQVI
jgi:hypothetical protein